MKRNKLCFNCLWRHQVSAFKSKRKCQKCHRKHHTSICQTPLANQQQNNLTTDAQTLTNGAAILHASTPQSPTGVLLKTAIATVSSSHTHCEAPILFDEGAQRSFITASLASELQLPVDGTETVCLSTFGGNNNEVQHLETATVFVMTDSNQKIPIRVHIVSSIATPIDNRKLQAVRDLPYLLGLKLAHSVTRDTAFTISLLIGADHYWDIVEDEIIRGKGPTAVRSKIGYLSGPVSDAPASNNKRPAEHILNVITSCIPEEDALQRFWNLESMGIVPETSDGENADSLKEYQDQSIELKDGRYYAKLPWKQEYAALPSNYEITLKRTESTISRLRRESGLKKYDEIIREQERRGFIELVPAE